MNWIAKHMKLTVSHLAFVSWDTNAVHKQFFFKKTIYRQSMNTPKQTTPYEWFTCLLAANIHIQLNVQIGLIYIRYTGGKLSTCTFSTEYTQDNRTCEQDSGQDLNQIQIYLSNFCSVSGAFIPLLKVNNSNNKNHSVQISPLGLMGLFKSRFTARHRRMVVGNVIATARTCRQWKHSSHIHAYARKEGKCGEEQTCSLCLLNKFFLMKNLSEFSLWEGLLPFRMNPDPLAILCFCVVLHQQSIRHFCLLSPHRMPPRETWHLHSLWSELLFLPEARECMDGGDEFFSLPLSFYMNK